jgi:hypothetical protein
LRFKKKDPSQKDFENKVKFWPFKSLYLSFGQSFLIKHFTLEFIISLCKAYLIIINNLECNIIWILQFINNPINWPSHVFLISKFLYWYWMHYFWNMILQAFS